MTAELCARVLLHFVWQGAVLGVVAAALLWRTRDAQRRHDIAAIALVGMLAAPLLTAWALSTAPTAPSVGASAAAWHTWVVGAWLAGAALLLARAASGLWGVARLRRRSIPAPPSLQRAATVLAHRMGLEEVPVRVVPDVLSPLAAGVLRPVVLLPAGLLLKLPPGQIEALVAHELAHVRRHDYLVNVVQAVAEALLFYHPAVWWVSARLREARELCADDLALAALDDRLTYARALTELAAVRAAPVAPAARGGSLMHRIRRVLDAPAPPSSRWTWLVTAAALTGLLVASGSLAGARARAATQPEDVGAAALDYLSDQLEQGADELESRADRRVARKAARVDRDALELEAHRRALEAEIAELDAEVRRLRAEADHLRARRGLEDPSPPARMWTHRPFVAPVPPVPPVPAWDPAELDELMREVNVEVEEAMREAEEAFQEAMEASSEAFEAQGMGDDEWADRYREAARAAREARSLRWRR